MKLQLRRRISLGFGLIFILIVAIAFLSVRSLMSYISANEWWIHTHEVLRQVALVSESVSNAEAEERDYLIFSDQLDLKQFHDAATGARDHFAQLKGLIRAPQEQAQLPEIAAALENLLGKLEQQVKTRKQEGMNAALKSISTESERNEIDKVQAGLEKLSAREDLLLDERGRASQQQAQSSQRNIVALAIFLTLFLSGVYYLLSWDIREYRKVWTELQQSEQGHRLLVELSPEAVLTHSDSKFTYINRAGLRMFGAARSEEIIGREVLDLVHPDDRPKVQEKFGRMQKTGEPAQLAELRLLRLDGSSFPVEIAAAPISYGKRLVVQAMIREISDRKQIERQVRLLGATVRSVDDCISITDMCDQIIFVNESFCATYGYTAEELIGKNIAFIRSPNQPEGVTKEILPATLKGGWYGEVCNRRKDGSDFFVELRTSVVKDEKGEPIALVGIARDITQRKREEDERKKLIADLQDALANVKTLTGLLPICSSCKKIRDDRGYWNQIEVYVRDHSDADFSHGLCPECARKLYPEFVKDDEKSG